MRFPDVASIILLGGKSERMGRDKHLLPFAGKTLLEHQIEKLQPHVAEIVISSKKEFDIRIPGITVCHDEFSAESALAGIHAGLKAHTHPWSFVIACDLPFVCAEVIEWLAGKRNDNSRAVVPVKNGYWEPLCGLYHADCEVTIRSMLERQDYEIKHLYSAIKTVKAEAGEIEARLHSYLFYNMNTQQEYDFALRTYQSLQFK